MGVGWGGGKVLFMFPSYVISSLIIFLLCLKLVIYLLLDIAMNIYTFDYLFSSFVMITINHKMLVLAAYQSLEIELRL